MKRFTSQKSFGFGALMFSVATLIMSCATPTKSSVSQPRAFDEAPLNRPVEIKAETIVVDARPAFEYSTAHVPRSVLLNWSDYTEAEPAQRGIIQSDTFAAARRLARAGISPESHVVVLGKGLQGSGEEGRLAWTLAYLGVANVQFASLDSLKPRLTNSPEANPLASVPIWKPSVVSDLNASRDEVLFAINERAVDKPASYKGQPARLYRLIDVRSEKAYLGKEGMGVVKTVPNMDAINIPWQQFFTPNLRTNQMMISQLRSMGFSIDQRLIVLDENGVASAAVTMALRSAGFSNAANYSGGLQDLLK